MRIWSVVAPAGRWHVASTGGDGDITLGAATDRSSIFPLQQVHEGREGQQDSDREKHEGSDVHLGARHSLSRPATRENIPRDGPDDDHDGRDAGESAPDGV